MKGCITVLLSVIVVFSGAEVKFETLDIAADSYGQVDIYANHTVVESRLVGRDLYGFMMNSVVRVYRPRNSCLQLTSVRHTRYFVIRVTRRLCPHRVVGKIRPG